MTTKTQDIVSAIKSILTTAGLTVRDNTDALYNFEDKPVIVVAAGNERPQPEFGQGYIYWDLDVSLFIGSDGDSPRMAPEATRQSAHAALYADRTLGGVAIDIKTRNIKRSIDPQNPAGGITEVIYQIKYRVLESTV